MNILEVNVLVLAYIGDSVYENYIRHYLVSQGINNVNDLQSLAVNYVSARSQAKYLKSLMDINYFTDEEKAIIMRARNYKSSHHPKNCDVITYKHATAFEAVIGYLDLNGNTGRIKEIINSVIGGNIC